MPPAATATLQPGSPGPPAAESSPLQRRSACSLQEPRSAAGAHIRAPNRGGVGSGEHQGLQVFWKTRYGENISLGVSRKLPLTLCFKHVRLQRTKCLFQNTCVLLHVEAEAEMESKVTHSASQLA